MCMGSRPKTETPAPAPPPPSDPPAAPVINEAAANDRMLLSSNRKGRGSLRIDRASADPAGGASGLGIPV